VFLVVRRPKYACRACEEVVVQAPAPARLIGGDICGLTHEERRAVRQDKSRSIIDSLAPWLTDVINKIVNDHPEQPDQRS